MFDFYLKRGFIRHFGALSEAERKFKLPYLKQTLEAYNASAKADASDTERNDPFGRRHFDTVFHPLDVYYTSFITPASHYTMGGIRINAEAQVISRDFLPRVPVPNLFAAGKPISNFFLHSCVFLGEVAGGLHGKNRLGGNGMLESVVYGRIAGYNAARVASLELLNASLSGSSSERPMSLIVRSVEPLETRQHGGAGQAYDQGTFWKLTLSLRSLAQTSGLPLHASSLRYRASIVERRHHLHDTELTGTVIVMTPPSTIGYVSILLPPVGPTSLLRVSSKLQTTTASTQRTALLLANETQRVKLSLGLCTAIRGMNETAQSFDASDCFLTSLGFLIRIIKRSQRLKKLRQKVFWIKCRFVLDVYSKKQFLLA